MDDQKFWSKVDKSGDCWVWTGYMAESGHGKLVRNKKTLSAHRYSWILRNGEIQDDLVVRHKCKNAHCVNPDHLELGTKAQNANDMIRDGTSLRGIKNPNCKLKPEQVLEIRRRDKENRYDLAKEFNISYPQISFIINKRKWAWL